MKTLRKQTSLFTEEELTSLQVDSHANHTQPQESDLEKKMTDTSGLKCLEQFEKFNRCTLWAKTFAASLIGMEGWYSTRCRLIWKLKATKCSRFYFQLVPSTHHTDETEFGLLLKTPTKMDGEVSSGKKNPVSGNSGTLAQEIMSGYKPTMTKLGMLPTPQAMDMMQNPRREITKSGRIVSNQGHNGSAPLKDLAMNGMLPTPTTRDWKGIQANEYKEMRGEETQFKMESLAGYANKVTGTTSQLSPQFVLEMMGFPTDWTLLPFLSGEMNPSKQEGTQ